MRRKSQGLIGLAALLLLMGACTTPAKVQEGIPIQDISGRPIYHEYVVHPKDNMKQMEFYYMLPPEPGKYPVVFVLHGDQDPDRPGGAIWTHGWMQKILEDQIITVAVSEPDYGNSDGPGDYCGPYTIKGIQEVIRYVKTLKMVNPAKMAIYGVGQGALCAALVAEKNSKFSAVILQAGAYDLPSDYKNMKGLDSKEAKHISAKIERETGGSFDAMADRSVLQNASDLTMPTLLITGENDQLTGASSLQLAQTMEGMGLPVQLKSYKKQGHVIPEKITSDDIESFLTSHLQNDKPLPLMPAPDGD